MTPDERQMIADLFDRMRDNRPSDKDRDADRFISDAVRQTPDAGYMLVQSVLAQEHYLQQAGSRIEELEARMRDLEDELSRVQQQGQPRSGGGSFLGGLFGGGASRPADPPPASRSGGSVPSFGGGRSASPQQASYGQPGSPWGRQQGQPQGGGGFGQSPTAQQPAPAGGGGFMRSALTTAAGVAGGMLAANAIQGMLGGNSSAHAAGHSPSSQSSESSPYELNSDQDRQRALDQQQDAAQDAELEQDQVASYDDSSDWGGADDSDF